MIKNQSTHTHAAEHDGEFSHTRVPADRLLGRSHFAAAYSSEHIAGGEFVVGAAFAAWGALPATVVLGLLIGNLAAVLSWALVCAPVAVRSRLTLYQYLERVAGRRLVFFYNLMSGLIFAVIAGGMMTISAAAIRGLTDAPPQVQWYPTSGVFVAAVLLIGLATVWIALRGFARVTKFAKICAPWLFAVFAVCGLAAWPYLTAIGGAQGLDGYETLQRYVWTGNTPDGSPSLTMWQIAAFAWGLNLPLHLGMGDLSTLRFARKPGYGAYSAFAAYGGHFIAWLTAGMLGAASAALLQTDIGKLDIGGVVVPVLGVAGTAAVVVASFTTAVPSLYRAGLAFHAFLPRWSLAKTTAVVGAVTTLIACLPLIFLKWLDLMAYFNILTAPVGAVIAAEHFILPKLGIAPFWRHGRRDQNNRAAWSVWVCGMALAVVLLAAGMHLFTVFIPLWAACLLLYTLLAYQQAPQSNRPSDRLYHDAYGSDDVWLTAHVQPAKNTPSQRRHPLLYGTATSLLLMMASCGMLYLPSSPQQYTTAFQWLLALFSATYFIQTALWVKVSGKRES